MLRRLRHESVALGLAASLLAQAGAPARASDCLGRHRQAQVTYGLAPAEIAAFRASGGDLLALGILNPRLAALLNRTVLAGLAEEPLPARPGGPRRKAAFRDMDELRALHGDVMRNPQVRESLTGGYKGTSTDHGFCYGRATAAHLKAIQHGITRESVRKVWAVGDFRSLDGQKWGWHVATIVRAADGGWYAIDPIFPEPLPVAEWQARMQGLHVGRNGMRIFATRAGRFGVASDGGYRRDVLSYSKLNGFFTDLVDAIYREYSGLPVGAWERKRLEAARKKRIEAALAGMSVTVSAAAAVYAAAVARERNRERKRERRKAAESKSRTETAAETPN